MSYYWLNKSDFVYYLLAY